MTSQVLPADDRLKRKLGGRAKDKILPQDLAKAEAAVAAITPFVQAHVLELLAELDHLARQRPPYSAKFLYSKAHAIKGLAGTAGLEALGRAAAPMCRLLHGADEAHPLDPNLVTSIAVTMVHAAKAGPKDGDLLSELIEACDEAVDHAMGQSR